MDTELVDKTDESEEAIEERMLLCMADDVGFGVATGGVTVPVDPDMDDKAEEQLPKPLWQPGPQYAKASPL